MANGNPEQKDIARLDFNIKDALDSLDSVNKKLEEIAKSSKTYADTISKNLNKSFDAGNMINTQEIKAESDKVVKTLKLNTDKILQNDKVYIRNSTLQHEKGVEDRLTASHKAMLKEEEYNRRIAKSTESLYDKITQYAKTYVIYQGFNELKKAISETIDEMVEVEQQMVAIDRVLNESSLDIDHYRDKLIQLAADYGNSFDNVADVTLRLAQAGFDSQEALALTEKTLLALNTAELDATQATGDMVSVMSQWGLMTGNAAQEAKDYGDIIDKINKVADNYPTTSADIMEALKKVSSAFNLAGASIDETIATIVAAEKASQRGGKVIGTALSNITQQLKAEGKLNLAEELGLDFYKDVDKTEFKNIIDIFQEMADRMEQLKAEGKESSVEMQSLLELFTVFRRNVGASLLGEMSGEDNTYLQVLNDSLTATGYSLQENEKYMQTAKAAQAQLNAELLKLKTQVWDGGLEDVFRGMLSMGTDLVKGIEGLIKTFGALPTTIGAVVAAYTVLKSKVKVQDVITLTKKVSQINTEIEKTGKAISTDNKLLEGTSASFKKYATSVDSGKISLSGYGKELVLNTAKTAALTAATIALNAAISMGLSVVITVLVGAIDNWIHAEEKAIEKNKELMQTAQDDAQKIRTEREERELLTKELEETIKKYNQLDEDSPERTETTTKLYELQTQINKALEGTGKQVKVINERLDEQGKTVVSINEEWEKQISLLNQISYQDKVKEVKQLQIAMEKASEGVKGIKIEWNADLLGTRQKQLKEAGIDFSEYNRDVLEGMTGGHTFGEDIGNISFDFERLNYLGVEKQSKYLNEWVEALERAKTEGKDVGDTLDYFRGKLAELEKQQETETAATEAYTKALKELLGDSYNLTGYQTALQGILDTYKHDLATSKLAIALGDLNKSFSEGRITIDEYYEGLNNNIKKIKNTVAEDGGRISEGMQAIFAETARYIAEGVEGTIVAYQEGEATFYDYQEALAKSNQSLLELYATQNELHLDEQNQKWIDATGNVNEYASSLQEATNAVSIYSEMLRSLGDNYDYIAEHADAAGNAAFEAGDRMDEKYQEVASNFADYVASMRVANEKEWLKITKDIEGASQYVANEEVDVDAYVKDALLNSEENLNNTLNNANMSAQEAANNLGVATGKLLEKLGDAINGFDYTINFGVSGGIKPGGSVLNLLTGSEFKPTSNLALKITGTSGTDGSVKGLADALKDVGKAASDYFQAKGQEQAKSLLNSINPYTSKNSYTPSGGGYTPSSSSPSSSGGGGGGGSSRGSSGDTDRESIADTTKAEEDAYKERLKLFKEFISERERLEKRWVDKQKDLGLLSNKDYMYITQQRIDRYKEYLNEVEKATWMHEEDKLALEKEYSEKIEDLETDYLKYYREKLDDDIDALKKANKEKIDLIKEEADERINALKKVESENDRIRTKEEYEKKRLEHLEDISYWEQRTGREAQQALKEAKKNLKELDEQWEQQMEDWSIEDQIQAIEDERDAQITAIEDAQEAEIKAIEDMYNKKLQLFAETGKIIYDSSKLQSQALYNQYKSNFVDPLRNDLLNLSQAMNQGTQQVSSSTSSYSAPEPAPAPEYIEYTVERGDSLWKIAQDIYGDGNLWTKIYDENEDVIGGNPGLIYPGQVFNIPQFHEGGIFNPDEGLAILKRNEMVLKPEWSNSMEKLMKYFDNLTSTGANPIAGNTIQIDGNLVNIQADIKNESDMNRLTRKIEKVLTDKFNIKK